MMLPTSGSKSSEFKGLMAVFALVLLTSLRWDGEAIFVVDPGMLQLLVIAGLTYAGLRTGVKAIAHKTVKETPDA